MCTNLACFTGIFYIFRIKVGIIPGNDLGLGMVLFYLRQQSECSSRAAGEYS